MAQTTSKKIDQAMKPCICGRSKSLSLYGNGKVARIAPEQKDVIFGLIAFAALLVGLAIFGQPSTALGLVMIALIILAPLAIARMLFRHRPTCAARWAIMVIFGLGRFL